MTSATSSGTGPDGLLRSDIPARLDRLRWSRFHTLLVVGLGVAWIIDGLEVTIASLSEGLISKHGALGLGSGSVAFSVGTVYLLGEVAGALFFGRLSDKLGRKRLFMVTLLVYLAGGALTACTAGRGEGWVLFLDATRFIAGMGIGGEYAAINSAIDELIPSRYRGQVDITVNGTYWAGAFVAAVLSKFVVDHLAISYGWRIAFLFGPVLGFMVLFVRRNLPESPRWLLMHGRTEEAEAALEQIEARTLATGGSEDPIDEGKLVTVRPAGDAGFFALARTIFVTYPKRAILGATLMMTQSFLYNAIFFTYSLVLEKVFGVATGSVPYYYMVFAAGNFLGPLLLGRLFDTLGRKFMISFTYLLSGSMLLVSAILFKEGVLGPVSQTAIWCVIFFFASAGASAAYLTVSELFPVEIRAKAIAVFFCIAQSFGAFGPWIYGQLIGSGHDPTKLMIAYLIGAVVMLVGGVVEIVLGVEAAGRSLEELSSMDGSPSVLPAAA